MPNTYWTVIQFLITDLVEHGVIGDKQPDGSFVLGEELADMGAGTSFKARDELIQALTKYYSGELERRNVVPRVA